MGNWEVVICGNGPHDGEQHDDIDKMAAELTEVLREAGHSIYGVWITIGSTRELTTGGQWAYLR